MKRAKLSLATDYQKLIECVNEVDQDAACYLSDVAPLELQWNYSRHLPTVMVWRNTPQGHNYWEGISKAIGQPWNS